MYTGLHVKYLLFLSSFNQSLIFSTDFWTIFTYKISWKSIQWELSCSKWTERHDEAKSHFPQCSECAQYLHKHVCCDTSCQGACYIFIWFDSKWVECNKNVRHAYTQTKRQLQVTEDGASTRHWNVYDGKNIIQWKKVVRKMQQKYIIKSHMVCTGYKNMEA